MEQYGYKYELHPTTNSDGQYGVNISIQKKDHQTGKWIISASGFKPLKQNDKLELNNLDFMIAKDFNNYINNISLYNESILKSKDTLPIDFNK